MTVCRPNRATGSRTRFALQEEDCWGTLQENQAPYGLEITTETLRNPANPIQSQLIRGDRMQSKSQQGNFRPAGDVTGELQPNGAWPLIAKHALGEVVETVGSAPYTHTLHGAVTLPEGLTLEKRFGFPGGEVRRLQYLGSRVNELFIQIPSEGMVVARAGFICKEEDESPDENITDSPVFPLNNEPFNTFHGRIMMDINGDGTRTLIGTITSLDMLLNNSIDPDQFAIDQSQFRADAPEDMRVINGNLSAFFTYENFMLYQQYLGNVDLSIEFSLIRGLYEWRFLLPAINLRGEPTPQVGQRGPLNMEFQYEAFRHEALGRDIELTIINDDAVISTAA